MEDLIEKIAAILLILLMIAAGVLTVGAVCFVFSPFFTVVRKENDMNVIIGWFFDNATVQRKQKAAEEAGVKLKPKDVKKASQQALTKAREEVGSVSRRDRNIVITDKEWDAIQAGAVSESILKRILNNCDPDSLRQRAMPKETKVLNQAKINRIKAMSASYTIQQIAEKLGVSTSTVSKYLKGAN